MKAGPDLFVEWPASGVGRGSGELMCCIIIIVKICYLNFYNIVYYYSFQNNKLLFDSLPHN